MCFSFSREQVIASGGTISNSSVTILDAPAGGTLTFGSTTINTVPFNQYSEDMKVIATVPIGAGVITTFTPGLTKGTYLCVAKATGSDGSKPEVPVYIVVN